MPIVDRLYAFIAEEAPGEEGIPAHGPIRLPGPGGLSGPMLMPLVGADTQRIESMRPLARCMAEQSGLLGGTAA